MLLIATAFASATNVKTHLSDVFNNDFEQVGMVSSVGDPPGEWMRVYDFNKNVLGLLFDQTDDGGFIITGVIYTTSSSSDVLLIKTDEEGKEQWNKTFGGGDPDLGWSVKQTSDGGYIIAGRTTSFGIGDGYFHDAWLIKTDAYGNEEWNQTYGGTIDDRAYSVLETDDGGYIFCGSTEGVDYEYGDVWLVKTTKNGDIVWEKSYHKTAREDRGYSLHATLDGGYILGGQCGNYWDSNTGESVCDLYLLKTDSEGNKIWDKSFGETDSGEFCFSIDTTDDGGYIMGGRSNRGCLMIKIDKNGEKQWERSFNESGYDYYTYYICQTIDGGYILSGSSTYIENDHRSMLLLKTDSEGNAIWNRKFCEGTSSKHYSVSYCCKQLTDGSYVLSGYTTIFSTSMIKINSPILIKVGDNTPPDKPDTPSGTINGKAGKEYTYTTITTDEDGDQIYYMFDWGEDNTSGWLGPYNSGETCEASYTWKDKDNYQVRVKAKDTYDLESFWSDPLEISMPKNKAINTPFLQFLAQHPHLFPLLRQLLML